MSRVCFVINNIGDYHAARLMHCAAALASQGSSLCGVQASTYSDFYHHKQSRAAHAMTQFEHRHLTLSKNTKWSMRSLWRTLTDIGPTDVFTIGYSDRLSLATLAWAKLNRARVFFLADSKEDDQPRYAVGERAKSLVVTNFDGALVAGERHRRYFTSLGVRGPIEIGYDVIDNEFFRSRAQQLSAKAPLMRRLGLLPVRYVLCVSRLVDRKRLDLVLQIFLDSGAADLGLGLLLVGAGPNDAKVHQHITEMGLAGRVTHLRNVPNHMMPAFYAGAEALILASDFDQWGLCVNEAMALGVPCIVTHRCGVAGEIVLDGDTGFVFPAGSTAAAAEGLHRLLTEPGLRSRMSVRAARMLDNWNLDRFTNSVMRLVNVGKQ